MIYQQLYHHSFIIVHQDAQDKQLFYQILQDDNDQDYYSTTPQPLLNLDFVFFNVYIYI